ncbi:phenoloxidase-activating factor 1-like [Diabrotica virgifera virgifera]|uniref:Phenoloxidase-activating factor 1-like n=1 Tax=Diabrotica virgifera virgifera TaxID=50390 RepID=A0A6P7FBF4_DIAVI|nr:phenoloxidase-activating factor 1-like [Diabrotica virgifera virgifera]
MNQRNFSIILTLFLCACVGHTLQSEFARNPLIPDVECGRSVEGPSSSLVGNKEFPWAVRISFSKRPDLFACDGVLINQRYILTAGLCVEDKTLTRQGNIDKIRLGDHNCLPGEENCDSKDYVDVEIENVILHPAYGSQNQVNHDDIGLIRLKEDVKFTDNISPVCLPKPNEAAKPGEKVFEVGWSRRSIDKLKAEITISDQQKCFENYSKNFNFNLTASHLCAGGYPDGKCASSSGGGLVRLRQPEEKWLLEGITSFGPSVCSTDVPSIFTKVEPYLKWIHENVKN